MNELLIQPHQIRWIERHLIDNDIQFIIIGGFAVKYHCRSRRIKDLDLFIQPIEADIDRLLGSTKAIEKDIHAKHRLIRENDGYLETGDEIGIDIFTYPPALEFLETLQKACWYEQDGTSFPVISKDLLIKHKLHFDDKDGNADAALLSSMPELGNSL